MDRLCKAIRISSALAALLLAAPAGSVLAQTIDKDSDGTIKVTCPAELHVAPLSLPNGWSFFGPTVIHFSMLAVARGDNTVGCWYGKTEVALVIVGTTLDAGYKCKELAGTGVGGSSQNLTAICTPPSKSSDRRTDTRPARPQTPKEDPRRGRVKPPR